MSKFGRASAFFDVRKQPPRIAQPALAAAPPPPRQSRVFGDHGQAILRSLKVGIIGAGGVGSVLVELLARLGVGHLVVTDPDRVDISNLPRLLGATGWDAMTWLTADCRPAWLRRLGQRLASRKVDLAKRIALRANPRIQFEPIFGDFLRPEVSQRFLDCDYLFLAADPMPVRLLFNAVVHQYLIPGVQLGSKVLVNQETGELLDAYSVSRPVSPDRGCLWCSGFIPPGRLQEDAQDAEERCRQRYVNDPEIVAPSVITLNATAAAHAANDFLFTATGLTLDRAPRDYLLVRPRERSNLLGDLGRRLPMRANR
jgi:hypothetical protein